MIIIIYIFIYIIYNIYKYINNKIKFRFFISKYLTATTATPQHMKVWAKNKLSFVTIVTHFLSYILDTFV